MTDWSSAAAPSLDDFGAVAHQAYEALPPHFLAMVGEVEFRVCDFAEPELLRDLGIEDAFELTGIYNGVDVGRREGMGPASPAAMIFLYRRPILDEWAERGDVTLGELISHVLVHEIAHHFGISDDDIHAIEAR